MSGIPLKPQNARLEWGTQPVGAGSVALPDWIGYAGFFTSKCERLSITVAIAE